MNRKLQNAAFKLIDVIMILTMLLGMPGTVYAAPQAQDATPVLATVDADYAPGESAQITGSGFSPGGNYTLTALGPDSVLVDWASVTADSDGNFAADSPALSSAGSYLVSAFAADNMLAATVSFTVTAPPTEEPTQEPTATEPPTEEPTQEPTATEPPTAEPTQEPTQEPTATEPPTEPPTATSTPEPTSSPTPSGPPTIVSDKADYIAGEHVTLTGENWQGDTEVRIIVNDDIGQTWRRDVTVTVGADGTIYDSFNLPTFFVANYSVTARGQQTNRVATTSFTDAPPDLQNLWQCDPPTGYNPSTYTCATSAATGWVTGNNDGPFKEGETIPYRTRMQNLVASNQYSVTIEWDTTKSSKHALDYLKSFNATITAAQPCASLTSLPAGLCSGSPSTFPIPTDSFMQSDSNWVANGGVQDPGVFTMYGGTITGVSSYTTPGSYTGDTSTSITVFFTANSTDTVFAWGGHIASRDDWGLGNSAVAISGSPYHMRILSWFDVSNNTSLNVGNTDRSLSAEAVIFPASITIIKDAVPDDPQDFTFSSTGGLSPANFSLDDDADGTLSNTRTYSGITSFTTYAFTEAAVSGWALSFNNPVCTVTSANGGTQTGNVGTRTVSINLAEGENVTCTFINTKQQGTIIVKKVMIGGTDTFAFTGTPSGSISTNNGTISANVNPGTYTSTETVPAGWDLTSVTCDDSDSTGDVATKTATFNVASNETVTCTFTNEKDANIIVVKQTDPDGDPQIFNFSASYGTSSLLVEQLSVNSAQASPTYAQAILQSGVTYQIEVSGDYGFNNPFTNRRADAECVTEDSWNSNITDQNILDALIVYGSSIGAPRLNSQQNITAQDVNWGPCNTTTHTYTLTVLGNGGNIGFVISDNWEDPGPGCAAFCQNGGTFDNVGSLTVKIYEVGGFSLSDGQSNDSGDLDPGMYSVSEDVPAGWDLTSATCDDGSDPSAINLSAGETVTCTFTNQKDANIVVVKQTDPDGDPTSFEFDPSWGPNFFLSDDQQNDSGNLNPGTYSVSEIVPIDWKLDSTSCVSSNGDNETADNISLQAGETVTCTFFDVKYGVINIIKETNPDGDPTLFDFDVNYGGGDLDLADGGFHGSGGLEPGSYFVIENVPAGWDLISATCDNGDNPSDITLNAGDVVTCTFINEKDANIIVVKETEPDGDPTSFEFDPSWGSNFFLSDGQQNDSGDLDPGNYSVSENVPTGWNLTSATCSDNSDPSSISLQAGETVTCTFTNAKLSINVTKTADPTTLPEPGGPVAFTVRVDNTSTVSVNLTSLQDDVYGNLDGKGTCDVPQTIAAGGYYECTFTENVNGEPGSTHTDTVTATASGVTDSDDATVTITDVTPTILVEKTANPTSVNEPGGNVVFTFKVTNTSAEPVTIASLSDSDFGVLTGDADCQVGTVLPVSGSCEFTQTEVITGDASGPDHENTFTATATDNEGNTATDDDDATVGFDDVAPSVTIVKSADPTTLPEPGGVFTFTLTITNTSVETVEITTLTDDNALSTECTDLIGSFLAPGASTDCSYTVTHTDAGSYPNTASVTVADNEGNPAEDSDSETVTVTDVAPTVTLDKTVDDNEKPEPGGLFTYTLTITNTSVETVEITALTDTNALSQECQDLVGTFLDPGEFVSCQYTATFTDAGTYPNTASVTVEDDEGNEGSDDDSETVTITDVAPTVTIDKAVDDNEKPEPGGLFTYTLTITNTSVETVEITALTDSNALSAECTDLIGTFLAPGEMVSCQYTATFTDAGVYPNTANVTVTDDEGNEGSDDDSETVTITDVTPTVTLDKAVDDNEKPEPGGLFTYTLTITNTSVETVEITALTDSNALSAQCLALIGTFLAPGEMVSCQYTATFTDAGTYPNTANVTVTDDEGNEGSDDDSETVTITDVAPTVTINKAVDDNEKPEPGGLFTYTLTITNNSVEDVVITDLGDTQSGATDFSDCAALIGTTLAANGGMASCTYSVTHTDAGVYPNTADVTVADDEGNEASDDDGESVEVTDVAPTVTIDKVVDDNEKPEPGGVFTFTLTITNNSVETVEITALTDDNALSAECQALIGTFLAPGASADCTYTVTHTDAGTYDNTASVTVADNEGNPAEDSDSETVTVTDVLPTVDLTKTAEPTTLPEPGGVFTFTLTITNTSVEDVIITGLGDSNVLSPENSPECLALVGMTLTPGQTVSCEYDITHTDAGTYPNTASVTVADNEGNPAEDSDSETVTVTDVLPTITVEKTANPTSVNEPGGNVVFTFKVTSTSVEPVTIASLSDSDFGALTGDADCQVGTVLPVSGSCEFTQTEVITGDASGPDHENTFTATATDNDGNTATDDDDATVGFDDVLPTVDLVKTASPTTLPEPGGVFTFTLTITNTSVENVTITGLGDSNVLSPENSPECLALVGTTLTPGQTVSCEYDITHTDAGTYPNTASVTVADNEGNPAEDSDSETVTVTDVAPTVTLDKTVDDNEKPEPGGLFTYTLTITNTSVETVEITALTDTNALSAECLALIGTFLDPGEFVSCQYTATFTDAGTYPNTANVTVEDDEGNPATDDDSETITITDVAPTVTIDKAVDDNEKPEPGGLFTYTLTITNTSVETVEITALTDSNALSAQCLALIGTFLAPGEMVSCQYTATFTDAGVYPNTANVTVTDDEGNEGSDDDSETVTVTDVLPTVDLTKTAEPTILPEPGGVFTFTLTITNTSVETVEITALTDDNALSTECQALVGTFLAPGASTDCTYTITHTDAGTYDNTASVTVEDNEGNPAEDSDSETVTVTDVPPTVDLTKTADPLSLPEPGGMFTFTLTITNNSVETVEITALTDDNALSAECQALIGTFLAPGASADCTYTVTHTDAGTYDNTASVTVADNEGNPAEDSDSETVTVTDVAPTVDLVKTAEPTTLPEPGGVFTFTLTITNTSVETVEIIALTDDNALSTECTDLIGTFLTPGASTDCTYTITHTDAGTYDNTASVTVEDNEGNSASDDDSETVTVTDVLPTITVEKVANPTSVSEPGDNVVFTFKVTNTSAEPVTIASLSDSDFGVLTGDADCQVGTVLPVSGSCEFTQTEVITGDASGPDHENTFTATATDNEGNTATDDDDTTVGFDDVLPVISVDKTANPTSVPEAGGTVTFTYTVTNNSVEPVEITSLFDDIFGPQAGDLDCHVGTVLGVGGSCSFSETHFVDGDFENGPAHHNIFTAHAKDNENNDAFDDDDATVEFTDSIADIAIDKVTVDGAFSGDGINILTGESIGWKYTVTNMGNVTLNNVAVTDSQGVAVSCPQTTLAVGESMTCTASGTAITGNYNNTGTAYGDFTDGAGNVESDTATDDSSYFGADPQIAVDKVTVDGATEGDGLNILIGETIGWKYTVTNVGNITLSSVAVTDSQGVTVTCPQTTLAVGESMTCTASGTASEGSYSNTGTASGSYTDGGGHTRTDTATDTSSYFGANPQIDIVKKTVGSDGTEGDNVFVMVGGTVTWKYYVTNTGNVALSSVAVTDSQGVTVTCPQTTLAVGESMTCTATGTNTTPAGTWYNNTGTASGSYTDSAGHTRTATDSDPSAYFSSNPGTVTNSQLCDFGPNFRLVFTPDSRYYTSSYQAYKLSDSNPGQFFYNVFYTNDGSTNTITMEIPYPFVTQGANPVHVYGGLTVNPNNSGTPSPDNLANCFVPTNTLAAYGSIITLSSYTDTNHDGKVGFGDVVLVNVPAEDGFQYINIHLDYGLEKTDGWVKQGSNANTDQTKYPGRANILNLTPHTFKAYADGVLIPGSTDTIYNQNEFKQVRGFGGLVYTWNGSVYVPLVGAKVRLYRGTTLTAANLIETMTADNDGWYLSNYIHKGRAATYTLALLDASGTTIIKTIQVTAGGSLKFGEGLFSLGGPTPNP